MKNLKKILALVMAFAMAFTMMAGAAFTDAADIKAADAVNMLTALGVIEGNPDGSFKPDNTVTRAEMAKMIFVVRNNKIDDSAYQTNSTKFVDITGHWAAGYIKFCESQGIIAGKDATHFDPDATVTGVEAAKMLLVVAGYDPAKAVLTGPNWSANTLKYAGAAGILDDVNSGLEAGLPRQYAAQMIYNTLDVNRVKWSTDSDSFDDLLNGGVKETVGKAYMGLTKSVGVLTTINRDSLTLTGLDEAESDKVGSGYVSTFTKVNEDYTALLGQKVKVMFKDGKSNNVLGVYAVSDNEAYTVNASAVEADGKKVKFGGKSYSIENAYGNDYIDVYYTAIDGSETTVVGKENLSGNASAVTIKNQAGVDHKAADERKGFTAKELFDDWDTSAATMQFVDNDGNGRLDTVIITDYTAAEVTSVSSSKIVAGKSYNFDDENIDENLAKDDWAVISYDRFNDCKKIAKADVVNGKLSAMKKDSKSENKLVTYNEYQIDSTWYNEADDKDGNTDINTVKAADTVEAVIVNGVAYKMKRSSGTSAAGDVTDIAMVINKDAGIGGNQVKLQFFNDTTKVVDVDDDSEIKYSALNVGQLYEYSISGGEYSFENPIKTDDYYGDYTYQGSATFAIDDTSIGNKSIDDKAKVILFAATTGSEKNKGNDSKVITGKQLKALKASEGYSVVGGKADYFTADMSGLKRTAAVAFEINKMPTTTTSNDYYGYILSDAVYSNGNNEVAYDLLLENGETATVYEKNAKTGDRKANTLIGYKSLGSEDDNGKRYIDDVHNYKLGKDAGFGLDAITDVSNNKGTVQFAYNTEHDVVNDTVVFYVDTDAKTGSTEGTIRTATKYTGDGVEILGTDGKGSGKMANCLYLNSNDDDLEVLVVDINDNQFRGPYVDDYKEQNADYAEVSVASSYEGVSALTKNTEDVLGKKVAKGDTLTATIKGVDGLKTKVTVTGGTVNTDTVTGTSKEVTIKVDGSANELKISTKLVDGKIAAIPTTISGDALAGGTYVIAVGIGDKPLAAGDTVDIGTKVDVKVKPGAVIAAGKTDTIKLMNGTTELASTTFTYGDTGYKTLSFTMPETNATGISLTLTGTTASETVAALTVKGVKYLDDAGLVTDTKANVRSIEITFSKAVDETKAKDVATNYTFTNGTPNAAFGSLSTDGTVVTLTVDNLTDVNGITVKTTLTATDGGALATDTALDISSLTK
ncbi:S-layer homology domain-containing protein [Intestinibacillus massiliensis]